MPPSSSQGFRGSCLPAAHRRLHRWEEDSGNSTRGERPHRFLELRAPVLPRLSELRPRLSATVVHGVLHRFGDKIQQTWPHALGLCSTLLYTQGRVGPSQCLLCVWQGNGRRVGGVVIQCPIVLCCPVHLNLVFLPYPQYYLLPILYCHSAQVGGALERLT